MSAWHKTCHPKIHFRQIRLIAKIISKKRVDCYFDFWYKLFSASERKHGRNKTRRLAFHFVLKKTRELARIGVHKIRSFVFICKFLEPEPQIFFYSLCHFLKMREVFTPPKAKLFDITYSASILRPSFPI